jgi:hypothetical protein
MTRINECDICGKTFKRTYAPRGKRQGRGSAKVYTSFRRRLVNLILGPFYVLKVWDNESHRVSSYSKKDLCRDCQRELRDVVRERVRGDDDGE